jgi:exonuclease 3'-5' domain-containing protein 1
MCFVFDVLDKTPDHPVINWLRGPLEDGRIKKIIHDCRMDSDALYHRLGITLTNVHDTSCWMNLSNPGRMST